MKKRTFFMRALTNEDCLDIEQIFLTEYKDKPLPPGGFTELWFQVISHFQAWCDDDVIPAGLKAREQDVIEQGLANEYFCALLDIVEPDEDLDQASQAIMLMSATSGQRREALKVVLG